MGYPELLAVLAEEAAREARELRDGGRREAARIVAEARAAAEQACAAALARERREAEARRRGVLEGLAVERARALLVERRRLLAALRDEVERALPARGGPDLDARLLAEVLPEVGDAPFEVRVDPGAEEACRAALARLDPGAAARATVRAAEAPRGGVEVTAGRHVLDDTLPARLARAWPALEAELAGRLLGEP